MLHLKASPVGTSPRNANMLNSTKGLLRSARPALRMLAVGDSQATKRDIRMSANAESPDAGDAGAAPHAPSGETKVQKRHKGEQSGGLARRGAGGDMSLATPFAVTPFRRLPDLVTEMQREMNQLMNVFGFPGDDALFRPFDTAMLPAIAAAAVDAPMLEVEVQETDKQFIISADVPGFSKDDIKVSVSPDNVLTISGELKEEKDDEDKSVGGRVHMRRMAKFVRRFRLPDNVNDEAIEATTKNGRLCVTVPKSDKPEHKHKEIQVKGA